MRAEALYCASDRITPGLAGMTWRGPTAIVATDRDFFFLSLLAKNKVHLADLDVVRTQSPRSFQDTSDVMQNPARLPRTPFSVPSSSEDCTLRLSAKALLST